MHTLEALDENKITARGKEMLQLPTHPRIAHMLVPSPPSPLPGERGGPKDGVRDCLKTIVHLPPTLLPCSKNAIHCPKNRVPIYPYGLKLYESGARANAFPRIEIFWNELNVSLPRGAEFLSCLLIILFRLTRR
ncbi:MAG: hypothetical protein IPJ20_21005 [Flammeovirgaceae bacterium]|nr:hypothetical protein [Flammeovirgaceae bacterium]